MNKLIYGVAYYPEYEHENRIDKDFKMMQKAGINTIRIAESTWSTWEPLEGEYDFSILLKTLDKANEYGLNVIVGTPTYAVPAWLVKKDPDVLATTENGRGLYGPRQIMDITNMTYLEACENIVRKMMEAVQDYECIIGFQIDNETKHYGTAGKNVQDMFKTYLINKFKTVENINNLFGFRYWSNSISTWDDLPDVLGTINGSYAAEFELFQRQLAANFLLWQRHIIDEYRRDNQFVTHNFDFFWKKDALAPFGHSFGVQPGINHLEASKATTLLGCDIYHTTQDDLTGAEIAYDGDSIRSLRNEQYLVLETQAQAFRYWTPYPGQLKQQALSHLASGALGVEYWHWHSIHNSFETYWKGLLSHDMEENAVYREACEVGEIFKNISHHILGAYKKNDVALIVDNRSQTALKYFPVGDKEDEPDAQYLSYNDITRAYYDALYEQNIECDILDVEALKDSTLDYKMIVTPALYVATEETISILRRFVEEGGVLLSSFKSFFVDENVQVRQAKQPYNLTDVFGMYYQQFTRPGKTKLCGEPVDVWAELLIPDKDTDYVMYEHKYWGNYAGITRNKYKKGSAIYIGCWCAKEVLKDEIRNAAEIANIRIESNQFPIVIRNMTSKDGNVLHFIFNYSENENIVICSYNSAIDILTGKSYSAGDNIIMSDWGTVILMERLEIA